MSQRPATSQLLRDAAGSPPESQVWRPAHHWANHSPFLLYPSFSLRGSGFFHPVTHRAEVTANHGPIVPPSVSRVPYHVMMPRRTFRGFPVRRIVWPRVMPFPCMVTYYPTLSTSGS